MILPTLGGLLERLNWAGVLWGGLWTALVAFSIGLSFLLWTRWGEYHLTGKCVMFSLLAHTIFGLFIATAEVVEDVVVALAVPAETPPLTLDRVKLISADDEEVDSALDGRSEETPAAAPWDRVTSTAPIESAPLPRPEFEPMASSVERAAGGEVASLPQSAPQPTVPIADNATSSEPELSRPKTQAFERADVTATPADSVATASGSKTESVPDASGRRAPPAASASPLNRVRIVDPGPKNGSTDVAASRVTPRIPAADGVVPESSPKPIVPGARGSVPLSSEPGLSGAGPTSRPEPVAKRDAGSRNEARASGSLDPIASVRPGNPSVRSPGREPSPPARTESTDSDPIVLPRPRLAGSGSKPGGTAAPPPTNLPEASALRGTGPAPVAGRADGPAMRLGTPELYRERTNPNRSEQAVRRGGSKASEEAVERALQWLAAHQDEDGHWDADGFHVHCPAGRACSGAGTQNRDDCAMTGLVLLAFLGAGNTHREGKYATNVLHGLSWLIRQEKANGDLRGQGRMYSQGIATLAMSEALGMSNDPKLRDPVQRAAEFIVAAQNPSSGGWRYVPGDFGDTSVFGWQLMALKSASLAGIEIPDTTWQKARGWLHRVGSGRHRGLAAYQPTEPATPPMTAEALVCRVFLGESTDNPTLREAADYLMLYKPQWQKLNLYYWYYGTLACFQMSGDYWTQWNSSVRDVLINHQVRDGHAAGSWDPMVGVDPWGREGGRVYSTALAALCLEVYYRFLPVQSLTADDPAGKGITSRTDAPNENSKPARNR